MRWRSVGDKGNLGLVGAGTKYCGMYRKSPGRHDSVRELTMEPQPRKPEQDTVLGSRNGKG